MSINGTIFDIKQFAIHDGPGIRTTLFFKGCPLDCAWCHNPEGLKAMPEEIDGLRRMSYRDDNFQNQNIVGRAVSVDEVMEVILRDEIFYDESGGGVTFSGGEPMLQAEFLEELLSRCRQHRLHTTVDSCGYADWRKFERLLGLTDLFLFDLKLIDDQLHTKHIGVSNLKILANLKKLDQSGAEIVIRLPLIPGITDTSDNLDAVLRFLESLSSVRRIDILPYNRLAEDKVSRFRMNRPKLDMLTQSQAEMEAVARRFDKSGLDVRIGG
ncbi:MAG: glycyl-radical enzyme activating protein [candidate division Zixibacteria bacterium]